MDPQIKPNFQHKITINAFAVEFYIVVDFENFAARELVS